MTVFTEMIPWQHYFTGFQYFVVSCSAYIASVKRKTFGSICLDQLPLRQSELDRSEVGTLAKSVRGGKDCPT